MEPWQWALIGGAFLSLIGAIWALIRHGLQSMQKTLTEHGERIRALEVDNVNSKIEVGKLRDMRHDIIEQVSRSLATWYTSIITETNRLIGESKRK